MTSEQSREELKSQRQEERLTHHKIDRDERALQTGGNIAIGAGVTFAFASLGDEILFPWLAGFGFVLVLLSLVLYICSFQVGNAEKWAAREASLEELDDKISELEAMPVQRDVSGSSVEARELEADPRPGFSIERLGLEIRFGQHKSQE